MVGDGARITHKECVTRDLSNNIQYIFVGYELLYLNVFVLSKYNIVELLTQYFLNIKHRVVRVSKVQDVLWQNQIETFLRFLRQ